MRELSVTLLCIFLCACAHSSGADYLPLIDSRTSGATVYTEYSFGVLPLNSAVLLFETYQPLIDEINSHVSGFTVRLETAKDHPQYEAKVRERRLHFVMMNSHLVIPAEERGYEIIGRTADKIRGLVLVRNDSGIRRARDLKAASISFASGTDLPGAMMPKLLLKQNGLDVDREATNKYVGSPDSAILNVFWKLTAAGCVSESAWRSFRARRPDMAQSLEVRWATAPLVGLGILARNDVPPEHVQSVAQALFGLQESERGRKILESMSISSFQRADEATYDRVWEFLDDYRRAFGYTPTLPGAN
jgi:ABC-type phosphate/phosphonate transport system substrate-binding protein